MYWQKCSTRAICYINVTTWRGNCMTASYILHYWMCLCNRNQLIGELIKNWGQDKLSLEMWWQLPDKIDLTSKEYIIRLYSIAFLENYTTGWVWIWWRQNMSIFCRQRYVVRGRSFAYSAGLTCYQLRLALQFRIHAHADDYKIPDKFC